MLAFFLACFLAFFFARALTDDVGVVVGAGVGDGGVLGGGIGKVDCRPLVHLAAQSARVARDLVARWLRGLPRYPRVNFPRGRRWLVAA